MSKSKIAQYTAKIAAQKSKAIVSTIRTVDAGFFANGTNFAYAKRARIREMFEGIF